MQLNIIKTFFIPLIVGLTTVTYGQIVLSPISQPTASYQTTSGRMLEDQAVLSDTDTLSLPFFDDFAQSSATPDSNLWVIGSGVFINGTMAIEPISLNVATFDGTNTLGFPYSSISTAQDTDILESKAINLDSLGPRDAVILSFFWQSQGYGEAPEPEDSITLEFFNHNEEWVVVTDAEDKAIIQVDENTTPSMFQEVRIFIQEEEFLHEGFKFRFTAHGNPTGPFDVWHLDYIYLDSGRVFPKFGYDEIGIYDYSSSLFKKYTQIPHDQLFAYPDTIFSDLEVGIRFLESDTARNPINPDFQFTIIDTFSKNTVQDVLLAEFAGVLEGFLVSETYALPALEVGLLNGIRNLDSALLETEIIYTLDSIPPLDNFRYNDTLRFYTEIYETLSYDDGTAEFAAGVNEDDGELAVRYNIPVVDTLTHVDIFFPFIYPLPSVSSISIIIYSDLSGDKLSTIYTEETSINYADSVNQFSRYELNFPQVLPAGDFFLSIKQNTDNYVSIGLDKNTHNGDQLFYKINGEWAQNTVDNVDGSIMIRPIFANSDLVVASNESSNDLSSDIQLYPNPASETLYVKGPFETVMLLDLTGKLHYMGDDQEIDVTNLPEGLYFLKASIQGKYYSRKVMIMH